MFRKELDNPKQTKYNVITEEQHTGPEHRAVAGVAVRQDHN